MSANISEALSDWVAPLLWSHKSISNSTSWYLCSMDAESPFAAQSQVHSHSSLCHTWPFLRL